MVYGSLFCIFHLSDLFVDEDQLERGLTTTTSIVLSDLVPLKNRGLLQGLTNIIFGLGSGLGGPIGGWMNDTLGWRRAFLIQIPLLLTDYVLAFVFVLVFAFPFDCVFERVFEELGPANAPSKWAGK